MEYEPAEESSTQRGNVLLTWPALVAIGWLLYELTAQPNLGAAVICAKFGWDDFRTGLWLRRVDPSRRRGRACFWLYLASGLWKMAITATIAIFAFAFLSAGQRQPGRAAPPPPVQAMPAWFPGVMMTAVVGFGLSTVTTWIAVGLAYRHQIKFWLSSQVHRYRRKNEWPPYNPYKYLANHAGLVLLSALILMLLPVLAIVCLLLAAVLQKFGGVVVGLVVVLVLTCIGPVMVLVLRDVIDQRFVARSPWECWGREVAGDEESVFQEPGIGAYS
jgi:hypothetical protein